MSKKEQQILTPRIRCVERVVVGHGNVAEPRSYRGEQRLALEGVLPLLNQEIVDREGGVSGVPGVVEGWRIVSV